MEVLDPAYVAEEETRVTRGWKRLQELPSSGLPITEYPLPEVIQAREQQRPEMPDRERQSEYAARMGNYLDGISAMKHREN